MPSPMLIKTGSDGVTTIEEVKGGAQASLTVDRLRQLQDMDADRDYNMLKELPTHEKIIWLKLKIDKMAPKITAGATEITVSRENLLADSMAAFKRMSQPRKVLRVTFQNEVSRDVGGISREFFTTIMQELLNETIGLFSAANTEQFSYRVAPDSYEIQGHDELFHFFGKLLGKAVFDRIPLNLCLNRSIFNALLGQIAPQDYSELRKFKHIDIDVANSLKFVKENDLNDFGDSLDFWFTATNEINYSEVELKPGGSHIKVTNANKQEFLQLKCHYHAYISVKRQLE